MSLQIKKVFFNKFSTRKKLKIRRCIMSVEMRKQMSVKRDKGRGKSIQYIFKMWKIVRPTCLNFFIFFNLSDFSLKGIK